MRALFTPIFSSETFADRLVFAFVFWSAAWITVSDYLLSLLPVQQPGFWWFQTAKGLTYVIVSATFLWVALVVMQRNEAAQRAINEHKFRALKEAGLIGICCWGADGKIFYANDALHKLLGYRSGELIRTKVAKHLAFTEEHHNAHQDFYVGDAEHSGLHEFVLLRKDGNTTPVFGGSAIINDNGERIAYFVNVSKLKESEKEKVRLQGQLMNSEKIAALGRLASGVAHNFNNELAIIVGYCSLVKAQPNADPTTVRSMDQVLKAAERARQTIRSLQSYGHATALRTESSEITTGSNQMPDTIRATVLLMEDVDDLREMMTLILTSRGFSVLSARDGLEALELAQQINTRLDLIISDVVMPKMNGPQAVHLIKQKHPGAKVIYVSGNADLIDHDCKDEVIWKPVQPEALIRSIHACLKKEPLPQSQRPAA